MSVAQGFDSPLELRMEVRPDDVDAVRRIIRSSGFFREDEVRVAVELVEDRLTRGAQSHYQFIFVERNGGVLGYACFGPIACTLGSFDLYWIAVEDRARGQGFGRGLMHGVEDLVRQRGGRKLYIETSSRPQYEPTRRFYERCGYRIEAVLEGFYALGDHKVIYTRDLTA